MEPPTILPGGGTRRIIERAVTLFPQPDSPTIPSVSPFLREKETSLTALTGPSEVKKQVLKF